MRGNMLQVLVDVLVLVRWIVQMVREAKACRHGDPRMQNSTPKLAYSNELP